MRIKCPHCQETGIPQQCERCARQMCDECIGANGLCGLCNDEISAHDKIASGEGL